MIESPKETSSVLSISKMKAIFITLSMAISLILSIIGFFSSYQPKILHFPKDYKFTEVRDHVFINETIPLDGTDYEHCQFVNVKFSWAGTAPFSLKYNEIKGDYGIVSNNDAINVTIELLASFGLLKEDILKMAMLQSSGYKPLPDFATNTFVPAQ